MTVHNHGPEGPIFGSGPDSTCPERRMPDGSLRGACIAPALTGCAVCDEEDTSSLGWAGKWYDVHRSLHEMSRAIHGALTRVVQR